MAGGRSIEGFDAHSSIIEEAINKRKRMERIFSRSIIAGIIYLGGLMTYDVGKGTFDLKRDIENLNSQKTELQTKVNEWNNYIPTMQEEYVSAYEDSIRNASQSLDKIDSRLPEMEDRYEKLAKNRVYSWVGFLKKD